MDMTGLLENLPLVAFRRLQEFLPVIDIMNLRCLNHRWKKKITLLNPSMFDTFYIKKINRKNCFTIGKFLFFAMGNPLAPQNLELQFKELDKLSPGMEEILVDYNDNITSLDVLISAKEHVLLKLDFRYLKCLKLTTFEDVSPSMSRMLERHAGKLKKLHVWGCPEDLDVPELPKLEALTFECSASAVTAPLLKTCQPTIHTLELISSNVYKTSEHVDLENSKDYHIDNLMHLTLHDTQSFNFFMHNTNNLVSLVLEYVEHIRLNFEWPELPKLRELTISDAQYLPLLKKARGSIEHFVYWNLIPESHDDYAEYEAGVLPKLTDLVLLSVDPYNQFCAKMISTNHKTLEFLYYNSYERLKPDESKTCERMMRVVMKTRGMKKKQWDKLEKMCPNAVVTFKNDMGYVNARRKRKVFSIHSQRHITDVNDYYEY